MRDAGDGLGSKSLGVERVRDERPTGDPTGDRAVRPIAIAPGPRPNLQTRSRNLLLTRVITSLGIEQIATELLDLAAVLRSAGEAPLVKGVIWEISVFDYTRTDLLREPFRTDPRSTETTINNHQERGGWLAAVLKKAS